MIRGVSSEGAHVKPSNIRICAAKTDRFPEGGGDAPSGLATILTESDPYLLT